MLATQAPIAGLRFDLLEQIKKVSDTSHAENFRNCALRLLPPRQGLLKQAPGAGRKGHRAFAQVGAPRQHQRGLVASRTLRLLPSVDRSSSIASASVDSFTGGMRSIVRNTENCVICSPAGSSAES